MRGTPIKRRHVLQRWVVWVLPWSFCMPVSWADALAPVTVRDTPAEPLTGGVSLSETTAFHSRIEHETLTRPGATLTQTLAREAGVQVRESGGLGSFSSATLRGSSSDQVMVYLDGLLLNQAVGGGVNLSQIDLLQADSVDIYRGSLPIALGQASLGGAIQINTPGNDAPAQRLRLGYGSFGEWQLGGLSAGARGKSHALMSIDLRGSRNDFPFLNDRQTSYNPDDDFQDHRHNAAVRQTAVLLKVDRQARPLRRFDASLNYFHKFQEIPDQRNSPSNAATLLTENLALQAAQRFDACGDTAWRSRVRSEFSETRETYQDLQGTVGLGQQHDRWRTRAIGIENLWERLTERSTLTASVALRHEGYHNTDLLAQVPDSHATREQLNLAIGQAWFLADERLLLTPALRLQHLQDQLQIFKRSNTTAAHPTRVTRTTTSPQFGWSYRLTPGLTLKGNWARYQRVPSFTELFGNRGLLLGNENLRSESGNNFDLGLQWSPHERIRPRGLRQIELSAFYKHLDTAIARVYDARGIGRSINIDGARVAGLEAQFRAQLGATTSLRINSTLQHSENLNSIPAFKGKQLPGQAEQSLTGQLEQRMGQVTGYYEFLGKYHSYYDTANLLPAAAQTLHTLGLRWEQQRFRLSFELRNLSNAVYEDFNGFPKPGRRFFLTLDYTGDPSQ